ncbi:hypothetical protein JST97_21090 [bacterium]|nr:hypothetical protein [bacterium]
MYRRLLTALIVLVASIGAQAVSIIAPVMATDYANSPTPVGYTYTLTQNYLATDAFSFTASGEINIATADPFGFGYWINAAGVTTHSQNTLGGFHGFGYTDSSGPFGTSYGSILVSANNFATATQVFLADASNGLGAAGAVTSVSRTATFADIFGGGLAAGTVLNFRVSDVNNNDNAGQFTLTGFLGAPDPTGAPELSAHAALTPLCMLGCVLGLSHSRRRQTA